MFHDANGNLWLAVYKYEIINHLLCDFLYEYHPTNSIFLAFLYAVNDIKH